MTSHRHRHRAGTRQRLAAALAAAAAVAGSVLVLLVPPASAGPAAASAPSAASAASAPIPPEIQPLLDQAVADATAALRRDECNNLLNPPLGNPDNFTFTAREVLETARYSFEPPPPQAPGAAASVNDVGRVSTIRIHPNFARIGEDPVNGTRLDLRFAGAPPFQNLPSRLQGPFPVPARSQRALALLHEVGHLTTREGPHEAIVDANGTVFTAAEEEALYNTRVLNTCIEQDFLITGLSCLQFPYYNSIYSYGSTLECFAGCRVPPGPTVLSFTTNTPTFYQRHVTSSVDEDGCRGHLRTECPAPTSAVPVVFVGLQVTDSAGRTSADGVKVHCFPPFLGGW